MSAHAIEVWKSLCLGLEKGWRLFMNVLLHVSKARNLWNHATHYKSSRWQCSDIMAHMLDIGYKEPCRKDVPPASSNRIENWTVLF